MPPSNSSCIGSAQGGRVSVCSCVSMTHTVSSLALYPAGLKKLFFISQWPSSAAVPKCTIPSVYPCSMHAVVLILASIGTQTRAHTTTMLHCQTWLSSPNINHVLDPHKIYFPSILEQFLTLSAINTSTQITGFN